MRSHTTPLLLVPLLLLFGLTACAGVAARPASGPSTPAPPPAAASSRPPSIPSSFPARPTPVSTGVAGVAAIIETRVTNVHPRLLPTAVPAGMEADVTAAPGSYTVQYTDDTHAHTIMVITDIPLGINGAHQTIRTVEFRGQDATYVIFDTTVPTTRRHLWWSEPGSRISVDGPHSGVQYSLIATGFTEAEFFQIANSFQPV